MNTEHTAVRSEDCTPCLSAPKKQFAPSKTDFVFALIFTALGYFYIHAMTEWFDFPAIGLYQWFTVAYAVCVLAYLYACRIKPPVLSYFWLGTFLLVSACMQFIPSSLMGLQNLFVHGAAVYWTLCAAGCLAEQKTGSFLPLDVLSGFIILPFGNFFKKIRVIFHALCKSKSGKRAAAAALGGAICLVIFAFVLPLLSAADAGFQLLLANFFDWFNRNCLLFCARFALSLPVSAWLYGLVYGCVHREGTDVISPEQVRKSGKSLRILPLTTVYTAVGGVCAAYFVFILLQGQYLFGGFFGKIPLSFSVAEYARSGFFELCRISAINLGILLCANIFGRIAHCESRVLRALNTALCALSLLLVSTAFAKMALYIGTFGLTPKRVLATAGLVWFAVVFVCVLIWQWRRVSIMRVAAVTATILLCALSLSNFDNTIADYNTKNGFDNVDGYSYNNF